MKMQTNNPTTYNHQMRVLRMAKISRAIDSLVFWVKISAFGILTGVILYSCAML